MSLDVEPRTRPLPEFDIEQEVDFGRYVRIVLARWWLLVVGVVIGALIGLAVATTKSRPYEATAIVYLGQPYLPGNAGTPIQSLNTKFSFMKELLVARGTLAYVSGKTGIRPGILASRVSVEPETGLSRGKFDQPAPLVAVTVSRLPAKQAAAASNAFAAYFETYFSRYVDQKLRTYKIRLGRIDGRLKEIRAKIAQATEQQTKVIEDPSVPATEKYLLIAYYTGVINTNSVRENQLEADQISADDTLTLAQQVERADVLEPARVHRAAAPSRRTSVLIGGFVGLLVGIIAALLWDPVLRRVRSQREAV